MKDLVRGFIRWLIIVLLVLNALVYWGVISAKCQDVHEKHETREDFEDTMGFITVTFVSKDDRLIYWRRETKHIVKMSSFGYDKHTKFEGKLEGRLCVIYCKAHLFAYTLTSCK